MASTARIVLAALLLAIAAVHFYWASGGALAMNVAIPQSAGTVKAVFTPGPIGTAAVGLCFVVAAVVTLGYLLPALQPVFLRLMAGVFALRAVGDFQYVGFTKRISGTPFAYWDTRLFTPLCVAFTLLAIVGAGGLKRRRRSFV